MAVLMLKTQVQAVVSWRGSFLAYPNVADGDRLVQAVAAGDWKLYTTFRQRLERVTTDDVQRVARTYLLEDKRTVGWYVPVDGVEV